MGPAPFPETSSSCNSSPRYFRVYKTVPQIDIVILSMTDEAWWSTLDMHASLHDCMTACSMHMTYLKVGSCLHRCWVEDEFLFLRLAPGVRQLCSKSCTICLQQHLLWYCRCCTDLTRLNWSCRQQCRGPVLARQAKCMSGAPTLDGSNWTLHGGLCASSIRLVPFPTVAICTCIILCPVITCTAKLHMLHYCERSYAMHSHLAVLQGPRILGRLRLILET